MSLNDADDGAQGPDRKRKGIRDHRSKNWFWVDNAIVDEYGAELGPYALSAYVVLCRMADDKTQTCFPSYKTIADRMGVARPTAIKAIKALEDAGLVDVSFQFTADGDKSSNIYTMLPLHGGKPDLPGSPHDSPPQSTTFTEGGKPDLPKQDSSGNKTNKQDADRKLKPEIEQAAMLAYAEMTDAHRRNYIEQQAQFQNRTIAEVMWQLEDYAVARVLGRKKS